MTTQTTTNRFHFFDGSQSDNGAPSITVRKGGLLVLNKGALELLGGDVTHVQIGYNPEKRAIGVCPAPEGAPGRYRLRAQKRGSSRIANGKKVFALYRLTVTKATSFKAEDFGNGIVGLTLPEAMIGAPEQSAKEAAPKKAKRVSA